MPPPPAPARDTYDGTLRFAAAPSPDEPGRADFTITVECAANRPDGRQLFLTDTRTYYRGNPADGLEAFVRELAEDAADTLGRHGLNPAATADGLELRGVSYRGLLAFQKVVQQADRELTRLGKAYARRKGLDAGDDADDAVLERKWAKRRAWRAQQDQAKGPRKGA